MRSSTRSSNDGLVKFAPARSGQTYAFIGAVHLNSPYDPKREAERLVAEETRGVPPAVVVILGDTLPYLREALREKYPAAKIISVYYHGALRAAAATLFPEISPPHHYWSPEHPSSLQSYLRTELPQLDIAALLVIEWPPSATAFPELASEASAAVTQVVRETAAEFTTVAAFSRTWLHNLFANFLLLDSWSSLRPHHHPVVIAASGPSLSRALPLLSDLRSKLYLVALPSSLAALRSAEVRPDLVVSVDGGYWAQQHLGALAGGPPAPLAMPLTGARGAWRLARPTVLLSAGSYIEQALFALSGIVPFGVVTTGTVAASAYEIAALLSDGPIIFAGLDLCNEGLSEHVHPHSFDTLFELLATRTTPVPTVLADRLFLGGARNWAVSGSGSPALMTYAGWFRSTRPGRSVYRLLPSSVALAGFRELDAGRFVELLHDTPKAGETGHPVAIPFPVAAERRRILALLLANWEERLESVNRTMTAGSSSPFAPGADAETADTELLRSLDPRVYQRYRRASRGEPAEPASEVAEELTENARSAVAALRRRFLL